MRKLCASLRKWRSPDDFYRSETLFSLSHALASWSGGLDRSDLFPHSDTLFAALSNAFLLLYGEAPLSAFLDTLFVSSVFPGIRREGRDTLFFPVPLSITPLASLGTRKKVKKVRFVSWEALRVLLDTFDAKTCSFVVDFQSEKRLVQWGLQYLVTPEEATQFDSEVVTVGKLLEPHVVLDRATNCSQNLYFEEDTWMDSRGSLQPFLFFLCAPGHPAMEAVLRLFIEEGIGGERFLGKGRFDWFAMDTLEIPQEGEYLILFSLAKPRRSELSSLLAYDLMRRGGFIFRGEPVGVHKNSHHKIVEGSLVRLPFEGENVDVSPLPGQPVISYGKALGLAFSGRRGIS